MVVLLWGLWGPVCWILWPFWALFKQIIFLAFRKRHIQLSHGFFNRDL